MEVNQISKLIQLYASGSQKSSKDMDSLLFGLLLESLLKNEQGSTNTYYSGGSVVSEKAQNTEDMPSAIGNAIDQASKKYGIDKNLIKSVIKQESSFDPNSVSSAGAQGLMQLMPKTAESLGVKNPLDILENVDGGTRYLRNLLDGFKGNTKLALAAYNGGIGRMNRLGVDTVEEINKMPQETQNYVNKVIKNYEKYKSNI